MWRLFSVAIMITFLGVMAEIFEKREFTTVERREYLQVLREDPDTSTFDKINAINELNHVEGVFEGDMRLTAKDKKYVDMRKNGDVDGPLNGTNSKRSVTRDRSSLWRTRIVPYVIDQALVDAGFHTAILESIAEVKRISCVQWIKRTSQKNYVKFVMKDGCWSWVGNIYDENGFQELSIGDGCETTDTILHEMFHTMGFYHEQSRPDRNNYVKILWENIKEGEEDNFNKYKHKDVDYLSTHYDFDSIMHYGKMAFSKNGQPTIKVIGGKDRNFGDAKKLSEVDKMRLNALYECSSVNKIWSSWTSYGPCDSDCDKSRQRFCFKKDLKLCPDADEYGIETEYVKCDKCSGVIDGHWGRWSAMSKCTATCGKGTRTRTRLCDNPTPKNGGKACEGSRKETLPCLLKPCVVKEPKILYRCTFDKGQCGWKNYAFNDNACEWTRKQGGLTAEGYYMAINAAGCSKDDNSRYISAKFQIPSKTGCFSFWYLIASAKTVELSVYIYDEGSDFEYMIWSTQEATHSNYKKVEINIKRSSVFMIDFQAVIKSPTGSVEIDDVVLTDGSC